MHVQWEINFNKHNEYNEQCVTWQIQDQSWYFLPQMLLNGCVKEYMTNNTHQTCKRTYPLFNKHNLLWDFAKVFDLFVPNSCVYCNFHIHIEIKFKTFEVEYTYDVFLARYVLIQFLFIDSKLTFCDTF